MQDLGEQARRATATARQSLNFVQAIKTFRYTLFEHS
jgi:hypothetical protein